MHTTNKAKIFLWYDKAAEEAARFYAETFPGSAVGKIHSSAVDVGDLKAGDVQRVEFTVCGMSFVGMNGGPHVKPNESYSLQIYTEDQAETDRLWRAIVENGGTEMDCGWCKDKWGFCWQITPCALTDAISDPDASVAKRAMEAMMTMQKIDIAAIETARHG